MYMKTNPELSFADKVKFSRHLTENIIITKDHQFFSVIKITGRSHQTVSYEELVQWVTELNQIVVIQCTPGVELYSYTFRKKASEYPDMQFHNKFAADFNNQYKAMFSDKETYINELYLCIKINPFSNQVLERSFSRKLMKMDEVNLWQQENIERLETITSAFMTSLRLYRPELLGVKKIGDKYYSEALKPFAYLINGVEFDVPITNDYLANNLCHSQIYFTGNSNVAYTSNYKDESYFGIVEIREYDEETPVGVLNSLLEESFEFVMVNSFTAISTPSALSFLKVHQQHMVDAKDTGETQIQQIDIAKDQLVSGHFIMGEHHCNVLVRANSPKDVQSNMRVAIDDISRFGVRCKPLVGALEAGFFAMFVGNSGDRPRPCQITSLNFLSFSSFHNFHTGKAKGNPWGDSIMPFRSTAGSLVHFNFHHTRLDRDSIGDLVPGHTLVLGKTGAGKSTLIAGILVMLDRFNPRYVFFDKDFGMKPTILALGGQYSSLEIGKPTGYNPFQCENTPTNISFIKELVICCIKQDGIDVLPQEEMLINDAVNSIMTMLTPTQRKFSCILQFIPELQSYDLNARPGLYGRVKRWCRAGEQIGEYAWIFDNDRNEFSFEAGKIGIDTTAILTIPAVRIPIMKYLIKMINELKDGSPFLTFFEEFWRYDGDEDFMDLAKDGLKTDRKKNALDIFITQEPNDALQTSIGKTIQSQLATMIVMRNPEADIEDYRSFQLTDDEIDLIKNRFSETDRRFLIRQGGSVAAGGNSAVAMFTLPDSMRRTTLKILSGTPANSEILDQIINEVGPEPDKWIPKFCEMSH